MQQECFLVPEEYANDKIVHKNGHPDELLVLRDLETSACIIERVVLPEDVYADEYEDDLENNLEPVYEMCM